MHDTDKILVFRRQKRVIKKGVSLQKSSRVNRKLVWLTSKIQCNLFLCRGIRECIMSIFAVLSERIATFFTPRVQRKLWKVHLNYPIDTCRDGVSAFASDRGVRSEL